MFKVKGSSEIKKIFFLSIFFSNIRNGHCVASSNDDENLKITVECESLEFFYTENGKIKYLFQTDFISRDKDTKITMPNGGTLTAYKENSEVHFKAHAKSAISSDSDNIWVLGGGVYIEAEGVRLDTKQITWDRKKKTLDTKDFVTIKKGNDTLIGEGLFANQDLSYYNIDKPKGSFTIEGEV